MPINTILNVSQVFERLHLLIVKPLESLHQVPFYSCFSDDDCCQVFSLWCVDHNQFVHASMS